MAGAGGGDLDSLTGISGGTDGTQIGNIGDRVKVDFSASPSGNEAIIPADEIGYFYDYVLNGGSKALNVNGSSTPVVFTAGPGASEIWYVTQMIIFIQDGGSLDATDYGGIPTGITNGLLLEHSRNSVNHQIGNLQNNIDIAMLFSDASFVGTSNGFLNDANLYVGPFKIEPEITLIGSTSDKLRVTVRDNLTPLTRHRIAFRAWRIL